jgi:hypothetical protein
MHTKTQKLAGKWVLGLDNQYFTKVGRISDFWGVWQADARPTPPKTGFFRMFRELLIIERKSVAKIFCCILRIILKGKSFFIGTANAPQISLLSVLKRPYASC